VRRRGDPLQLLYEITDRIYHAFDYSPDSTDVDSPMDVVLGKAARRLSGLRPRHDGSGAKPRNSLPLRQRLSVYQKEFRSTPDATHAWVEAYLPPFGWVGFDPTNDILAGERHIPRCGGT